MRNDYRYKGKNIYIEEVVTGSWGYFIANKREIETGSAGYSSREKALKTAKGFIDGQKKAFRA